MYHGIPPEINAFRLTRIGAGPAAHVGQQAAYTSTSITFGEESVHQMATAAATAPGFVGLGGIGMISAVLPQVGFGATAAAHAESAAGIIAGAQEAYTAAVAATIPYEEVMRNQIECQVLVATNIFGQNSAAIAANRAQYALYWTMNANAMMAYLAAITAAVTALSVPLPPLLTATNPAGALGSLAGIGGSGIGSAVQALGSGVGGAVSAGTGAESASAGLASTGLSAAAGQAAEQATAMTIATPLTATPPVSTTSAPMLTAIPPTSSAAPAKAAAPAEGETLGPMQTVLGPLMSAPGQAASSLVAPLQSVAELPSTASGALMSPLSMLTTGMTPVSAVPPGQAPPLSVAQSPYRGMSAVNGGYAAGGSEVTASLTKGPANTVGLPTSWGTPPVDTVTLSASGASIPSNSSPLPAGMYPGGGRRRAEYAQPAPADHAIIVGPVITTEGVLT